MSPAVDLGEAALARLQVQLRVVDGMITSYTALIGFIWPVFWSCLVAISPPAGSTVGGDILAVPLGDLGDLLRKVSRSRRRS